MLCSNHKVSGTLTPCSGYEWVPGVDGRCCCCCGNTSGAGEGGLHPPGRYRGMDRWEVSGAEGGRVNGWDAVFPRGCHGRAAEGAEGGLVWGNGGSGVTLQLSAAP